jgi:hypothetical protein
VVAAVAKGEKAAKVSRANADADAAAATAFADPAGSTPAKQDGSSGGGDGGDNSGGGEAAVAATGSRATVATTVRLLTDFVITFPETSPGSAVFGKWKVSETPHPLLLDSFKCTARELCQIVPLPLARSFDTT